jgi:hypothetical protein
VSRVENGIVERVVDAVPLVDLLDALPQIDEPLVLTLVRKPEHVL